MVETGNRRSNSRATGRRHFSGWVRIPVLFGLLLTVQGCAALLTPWGYGAASTASYITTQKFFGDHLVSAVTGRDCTVLEVVDDLLKFEDLCIPPQALVEAPLFCRKTLGAFDCYREPNPYGPRRNRIANAAPSRFPGVPQPVEPGGRADTISDGVPNKTPQATEPEGHDKSPSI
jgi:hypothetical protein